jgi:hypothetical protein
MPAKHRLVYDDSPPHARKHRWDEAEAGFVRDEQDGPWIGKCSSDGFPELPARIPGGQDGEIARALRQRAQRDGFEEQFDTWIARWKDET